jgi:hypothetical protein
MEDVVEESHSLAVTRGRSLIGIVLGIWHLLRKRESLRMR